MRLLVLGGGLLHERYVSLASAHNVSSALRSAGHDVVVADLDSGTHSLVEDGGFDAVINMLHGREGEDGSLQAALELHRSVIVGSGSEAARLAYDKAVSPVVLAEAGIQCPLYRVVTAELVRELGSRWYLDALFSELGPRVVVKPRYGGSALGVSFATDGPSLGRALATSFRYDEVAIVQEFVEGVELSVCVVESAEGFIALPPVKVGLQAGEWYDFEHRTAATSMSLVYGDQIPGVDIQAACAVALRVVRAFGLRGFARVDLIVAESGASMVLEAAVIPGMTENSLFPKVVVASGREFSETWDGLVQLAVAGKFAGKSR